MKNITEDANQRIRAHIKNLLNTELRNLISDFNKKDTLLLSRKEAAKVLRIKENTLAVWASKGFGPAPTKIGNCVRYRWTVLEKFIIDNTMPR